MATPQDPQTQLSPAKGSTPPSLAKVSTSPAPDKGSADGFRTALRVLAARHARAQREGPPSVGRYLAQVGVLGWTIVIPGLLGMFFGRSLDHRLGTGIFWTAPLMLVGLASGCWGAWRWMHRP
jgi:ATP synthase protein I